MNEMAREWIDKAEGDFATALRERRARKQKNPDAVCFHAQQCIEKYLKACLQENRIPFTKTHDLAVLVKACLPFNPLWESWISDMDTLTRYAVLFRYPGESATASDAGRAIRFVASYRREIRAALGLKKA